MKILSIFLILVLSAVVLPCLAADTMITNEDLERRYPGAPGEDKGYLWQQMKDKQAAECEELRRLEAQARKAVHDENDPRPKNDRLTVQYRYRQAIQQKCGAR